jgi:hypothetical protein
MDALTQLNACGKRTVELQVAGTEDVWNKFARAATTRGGPQAVRWLGWLSDMELRLAAQKAHCLLLIPFFSSDRQGVPSKLYEYIAFDRPILVAGPDSGGVARVIAEWGHPPVVADSAANIVDSLQRACNGDFSGMLQRERCTTSPLSEEALVDWYVERALAIISPAAQRRSSLPARH